MLSKNNNQYPADIAERIKSLLPEEAASELKILPITQQAAVFGYFDFHFQLQLLPYFSRSELTELITEMSSDERADLFLQFSPAQQEMLLPALAQAEREDIRRLTSYLPGTIGAIMTSSYATLKPDLTAGEALEKLRREAPDKETIYDAYVIDEQRKLMGTVSLKSIILADPQTKIETIMNKKPHVLLVNEDQEEAAKQIAKYDVIALPVVNGNYQLVGIVTYDDALDVMQEEATEDFYKLATVGKITGNVRKANLMLLYRKRILWLVLLVFASLFSSAGIAYYEHTIKNYIPLIFFLPLLIASSGNAGSQSATLVVRALATGEITFKDWGIMMLRELLVSLGLGITMAFAVSLIGIYRGGLEIAFIVAISMFFMIIFGSLIGLTLPFVLSRIGVDPAIAGTPLITCLGDGIGVLIYFSIATYFLIS